MINQNAKYLGVYSSLLSALFTIAFGVFVILNNETIYFTSVLLLSLSVVIMIISMKPYISGEKKVFIDCGIAFGVMYAVFVSMVYYTQISVVRKGTLDSNLLKIVSDVPGTVFFYLDMFGYCLLCLATLFMAFAIERNNRLFRVFLFIHSSLLIPTFLLPFLPISFSTNETSGTFSGALTLIVWCIIFIPVCLLLTRYFLKQKNHQTI